jgi:cardiolipin synthase
VGSSNLNIQSWLGNWELDVAIEDEAFARQMEQVFLHDLENSTEVVLSDERVQRVSPSSPASSARTPPWGRQGRTARTRRAATAGALRMGRTFGAALTARRAVGIALIASLGVVGLKWPRALAYPLGVLFLWISASWSIQAIKLWPLRRQQRAETQTRKRTTREDAA